MSRDNDSFRAAATRSGLAATGNILDAALTQTQCPLLAQNPKFHPLKIAFLFACFMFQYGSHIAPQSASDKATKDTV